MMPATPTEAIRRAKSSACTSAVVSQPRVATLPSRASIPTKICSGKSAHKSATNCECSTAAVPKITRLTPALSTVRTVASSRIPPPTCTRIGIDRAMASITFKFFGLPSLAPSRSTTCRYFAPWLYQCCAIATGSSPNTSDCA